MDDILLKALRDTNGPEEKAALIAEAVFTTLSRETALVARRCVLLHWFNQAVVEQFLLGTNLTEEAMRATYVQIMSLPFIESLPWGLAFQDLTREGLLKNYISTQPDLLRTTARLAAPVYQAKERDEASAAEALFCSIIAGDAEVSTSLLNTLLEQAMNREDWLQMGNLLRLQQEAEQLPFVEPIPCSERYLMLRSIVHRVQGELDAAIDDYTHVLAINPKSTLAYLHRGIIYAQQLQYEQAQADYDKALQLEPTIVQTYIDQNIIFVERNRLALGSSSLQPEYAVTVIAVDMKQRQVLLQVGAVHAVSNGAKFAVYPQGVMNFFRVEKCLAVVEIIQLGSTESWAKIVDTFGTAPIEAGAQAVLHNPEGRVQKESTPTIGAVAVASSHVLKNARLKRGWTQKELAEKIGTAAITVNRWETGTMIPTPYFERKLRELFLLDEGYDRSVAAELGSSKDIQLRSIFFATTRPPFHEQLRYERALRGWSQGDLAEKVGCDTKTVGRWESGDSLPRPYHRQALCELFEKNAEELGLLKDKPGNIEPLSPPDHGFTIPEASLSPASPTTPSQLPMLKEAQTSDHVSFMLPREDWGEAPHVVNLYGRDEPCAELTQWIGEHHCQMVAILGMGGVGKTAVAAKVAMHMKASFEYVFWRSLHNAPPLGLFLKQCISFVSDQHHPDLSGETDEQISLLIQYMRDHHCLLVLDNFESVLQTGQRAGQYREGYAAYGRLLQRVGEAHHQSCLVLTSREKPKEVAHFEGKRSPVRSLHLSGLTLTAGQQMLQGKDLSGSNEHWAAFVERYSGNPLALQIVSESIQEVFGGNVVRFLQEDATAFGDITDLLDQQFQRLSAQGREIMSWLAIEREALSLDGLRENLVYPMSPGVQLETLESLRRRSLIEARGSTQFILQPVIMEYVTMSLIERASQEFDTEAPHIWIQFAFCKAQAKDYVRESQVRLLLTPIAQHLLAKPGKEGIEQRAKNMLTRQRQGHTQQSGYLAGNILNLLSYLQRDLRGIDFSHLVVRQAYLQGVMLPEVNFAYARFVASTFSHTFGNILAVAYSPQGDVLAAGTSVGEIRVYDAPAGVHRFTCQGHTDGVWSLAFHPDGRVLASSSDDHTIRLWESHSGHCLSILQGHTNRVRAIAFSPDGTILASGSDDQTIRLWDVSSGHHLKTLHGHTGRVWSVAYSSDGDLLASGSTDQTVRLWDTRTGKCLTTQHDHSGWVRSVAFHAKERILASGSDDQTIRLWKTDTSHDLKTLQGHTSRVWSVAFHPAGDIVASSSEDQTIRFWNVSTSLCVKLLQGHNRGVRAVAFTPDGQMLATGGDDQSIRVWDVASGHCLQTIQGYTNRIWSMAFHPDGSLLASASEGSIIRLWDVKTAQCFKVWQDRSHGVMVVAFSPHGKTLASGGQDETVRVWDVRTGRNLHILRGHSNWVRAVIFSPDGNVLASGSEDGTIRLWDVQTGACSSVLQGHTSWVRSLAFSPDGSVLASSADDHTIRLWHATTGLHLRILEGHTDRVRSIAFSPNGKLLASGSEDQTIRLWDINTGHCLSLLQGHAGWIRSVAFSPDGNVLASGSEDQTARLWDLNTGHCLRVLQGHANRVRWVTFSPDGNTLATGSDDGTIKFWDIQTYACLRTLIGERPYERMNIAHIQGLTEAQKANLRALGAIEES